MTIARNPFKRVGNRNLEGQLLISDSDVSLDFLPITT